jgi:hypothetical protein
MAVASIRLWLAPCLSGASSAQSRQHHARLFYIMCLCNPAGLLSTKHTLIFEELHKITLCNLALGMFYWRDFLPCGSARLLDAAWVRAIACVAVAMCLECVRAKSMISKTCRRVGCISINLTGGTCLLLRSALPFHFADNLLLN